MSASRTVRRGRGVRAGAGLGPRKSPPRDRSPKGRGPKAGPELRSGFRLVARTFFVLAIIVTAALLARHGGAK